MQEDLVSEGIVAESCPYNVGAMPRKLSRPRPKQGARLAELRKAAGLSQYQLARLVGQSQANIAYWERTDKPPRSDVLPKLATALGVGVEDLLDAGPVVRGKVKETNGRLIGKMRVIVDEISKLPRRRQEKIAEFLAAFVSHYGNVTQGLSLRRK
jgi:transcriptional regulator with XRE-family HTH domain